MFEEVGSCLMVPMRNKRTWDHPLSQIWPTEQMEDKINQIELDLNEFPAPKSPIFSIVYRNVTDVR